MEITGRSTPPLTRSGTTSTAADNGRTSSSDTWRPPRTTSRRATRQRLKHDIDISLRFLGTDACDGHVFYQMRNTNPRR
ncbi:qcr9 subunit 9 of the ubiquinol cytochrome-c reductase complex [Exserohilum turcicum]